MYLHSWECDCHHCRWQRFKSALALFTLVAWGVCQAIKVFAR
jgi:hypothetical protein